MSTLEIVPISAFSDNYIWCIKDNTHCWVVDPGDAKPVLHFCQQNNLTLVGILVTHHHWDHTNGINELVSCYPNIPVIGPNNPKILPLTQHCKQGDEVTLAPFSLTLEVIEVPGHTLDHIAYVGPQMVFCGDTLFSAGCGRLFEGTPEQMFDSLQALMQLCDETAVYCTHEYTLANIAFAKVVEPSNKALRDFTRWANTQRQANKPTLPSTIKEQKAINPFLRTQQDEIKKYAEHYVGKSLSNEQQTFTAIRQWKDNF